MVGNSKIIPLEEAISYLVKNGDHISLGGFTINRNPMAAVYEIIRQKKRKLHLYAHSNGQALDELVGGGCVDKIEVAYSGTGLFASTCIRFKKAVESGEVEVEDYSNYHMSLRFLAGAMGIPFMPTKSGFGTDILSNWGFERQTRRTSKKIPEKKMIVLENPFKNWMNTKRVILVPAIHTDVAIIHAQQADKSGLCNIMGLPFVDIEQAKSSDKVIITCEEIVKIKKLRLKSDSYQIPSFIVDAVVNIRYGSYPTACYNYYDYDPKFLRKYAKIAKNDLKYKSYLKNFIFGTTNHSKFIEKVSGGKIDHIEADINTGYARGMDRR